MQTIFMYIDQLLKYKENTDNICDTFNHNFQNISLYEIS